ncbi:MAG TPA: hypothetical protein VFN10_06300 [Thermoanaerobaculia bacterium]|nr:hypothetical protein [Thermoanaerobaculia bacterium]
MFALEALRAKHGDSLLLHYGKTKPQMVVIDGGPAGVFNDALRPRLDEIRAERKIADTKPLPIELMMVSHLDADHITGVIDLVRRMREARDAGRPVPWQIARFWHNTFDDILGNDELKPAGAAALTASFGDSLGFEAGSILASVGQGRDLRDLLKFFQLDGNAPFEGPVMFDPDQKAVKLDNLQLTVVGPDRPNLAALQKDWNEKVKALLAKKDKASRAEIASFVDRSVYNLSSIVVFAKADNKTALLTGDARGDFTLSALEGAGLLKKDKPLQLDLLKLPHHGSVRDVAPVFFERLQAKHYVISADGKHSNPDIETLELISKSRKDDDFTSHIANDPAEFADKAVGKDVAKFFATDRKKRKYNVVTREKGALSIRVDLA